MPPLPPNLFRDGGIGTKTDFRAYENLDDEYLLEYDRLREENDRRGYPMSEFEKEYLSRMLYEEMYMYKLTDEQRAQFHGMTLTEYKNAANNYEIRPDEERWWYEMPDAYKRLVDTAQTAGTGGSGTGGSGTGGSGTGGSGTGGSGTGGSGTGGSGTGGSGTGGSGTGGSGTGGSGTGGSGTGGSGTGGSGTGGSGTPTVPKKKTSYMMYILIVVLLIIIGLIIYFIFNKKSSAAIKKLPTVVKTVASAFGLI
jgi:cobalamin biosynthesis Mg chelatase CobN